MLIGADMNCYSVARAFHEAYGIESYAFGRWPMGDTMYSKIVHCTYIENVDEPAVLLQTVTDFANAHAEKTCVVLGCTDDYASLLMEIKEKLPQNCIAPYISPALRDKLVSKADFYALCDEYAIPYPKTVCVDGPKDAGALSPQALGFAYPIIVKPSSSIQYWKYPFDGMKKVYTAQTAEEAAAILAQIYGAGYPDKVILQDMIPGDDSFMHVLTAYCDKNNSVKMMCLGHVLLEEHQPHGVGNHACIITEPNDELMGGVRKLLEDLHFVGYSNFDVKYDERDGSFKFFDFNTRQGRSNYYVTNSGFNVAKYVVDEYVFHRPFEPEFVTAQDEALWMVVPMGVVDKYVKDPELRAKVHRLDKEGKGADPSFMKGDFVFNRWLRMWHTKLRHFKLFKTYYK